MQPETVNWLLCGGVLDDIAKDQFAFAPRVAGIDNVRHIFVLDELTKNIDARTHSFCRREFKFRGHNGQFLHIPLVLRFHGSGYRQLKELTDGPRNEIFLILVVILAFLEAAERLGDIAGHGWLLGNYERLGHGGWQSNPVRGFLQVGAVF